MSNHLSPTQIGRTLDPPLEGKEMNKWLAQAALQVRGPDRRWVLTEAGRRFATERTVTYPGETEPRRVIRWSPEVIPLLPTRIEGKLPWLDALDIDSVRVAHEVGLTPGKAGHKKTADPRKFACPSCDSSDALHAWPKGHKHPGFFCHANGCEKRWDNLDMVRQVIGLPERIDALRWLGERFPGDVPTPISGWSSVRSNGGMSSPIVFAPRARRPKVKSDAEILAEEMAALDGPRYPNHVYNALLGRLRLGPAGHEYMAGRNVDPAQAEGYGFRSVDSGPEWEQVHDFLKATFRDPELRMAGFPPMDSGRLKLPWLGRTPGLAIPYRWGPDIVGLHFRSMDPRGQSEGGPLKYQKLSGFQFPVPFNAEAASAPIVIVREGEINAYSLMREGLYAIGIAGTTSWVDDWAGMFENAEMVVAWYDDNKVDPNGKRAGDRGAARVRASLVKRWGEEWALQRWRMLFTREDPNRMEQMGTLHSFLHAPPWYGPARSDGLVFSSTPRPEPPLEAASAAR